jgi:hypothetical protein
MANADEGLVQAVNSKLGEKSYRFFKKQPTTDSGFSPTPNSGLSSRGSFISKKSLAGKNTIFMVGYDSLGYVRYG